MKKNRFIATISECEHQGKYKDGAPCLDIWMKEKDDENSNFPHSREKIPIIFVVGKKEYESSIRLLRGDIFIARELKLEGNRVWLGRVLTDMGYRDGQRVYLDLDLEQVRVSLSPCDEAELIENDFEALVRESSNLTDEARQKRLLLARKAPESYQAQVTLFRRNPDVVAEALKQAKGVCQKCKKEAPFIRLTDKKPYLEVHHKKRLSDGGDDTVENATALCPNCHRKNHYGVDDDTQPGSQPDAVR